MHQTRGGPALGAQRPPRRPARPDAVDRRGGEGDDMTASNPQPRRLLQAIFFATSPL
jgi:hypothetical protein